MGSSVNPRGQLCTEVVSMITQVDMCQPIVTSPERKLNYRFMAAEAYWILSGSQQLVDLSIYCGKMANYSDDGMILQGAYGPKFLSQILYVRDTLLQDKDSRQAVMTIWERNPRPSRDIPCTVSLQFLIRQGYLHTIVYMRSSDCWLGWPYDVFSFTMMTAYLNLMLPMGLKLGKLRIIAGSQHIYMNDQEKVNALINSPRGGDIKGITLYGLNTPDDLLECLSYAKNAPNCDVLNVIQHMLCKESPQ